MPTKKPTNSLRISELEANQAKITQILGRITVVLEDYTKHKSARQRWLASELYPVGPPPPPDPSEDPGQMLPRRIPKPGGKYDERPRCAFWPFMRRKD